MIHTPNREEQALAEVGHTFIGRGTAIGLVLLFMVTIGALPALQSVVEWRRSSPEAGLIARLSPAFEKLVDQAGQAWTWREEGGLASLVAINRGLLAAIEDSEDLLEQSSVVRERALPWLQWLQTALLGIGNEQAYVGRDGWLFYRADLDYVVGRGFLDRQVLANRARGGNVTEMAPVPDPRPALAFFNDSLERRGIRLVVMPTPVKPSVHPEAFSRRVDPANAPIQNPSFERLVIELTALGIEVFDPAPAMVAAAREGRAQFLETDTHWTPRAVELVAQQLAGLVRQQIDESIGDHGYRSREVVVDGRGDIAAMLRLPGGEELFPRQQVRIRRIVEPDGRSWRSPTTAEVLVLGDSFTNVFSDPELGWGAGGGLAEQLSFELDRPVARLALNAGGAVASRRALQREAQSGRDRLAATRVVVYQFAARELAQGSWPVLDELVPARR